jgi:hypothetical protein
LLHLLKLCVGARSLDDLIGWREQWLADMRRRGLPPEFIHHTRQTPRERDALLAGGSLYWVINGFIEARQRILDIRPGEDPDGRPRCALVLDCPVVPTEAQPRRPFQGWRYLKPEDAPPDAARSGDGARIPPDMRRELASLRLL